MHDVAVFHLGGMIGHTCRAVNDVPREEPSGPLTPDERRRTRELLTPQAYTAYAHYRDGHARTWIATRLSVSPKRVRNLIGDAQEVLGYARAYAAKQSAPGTYKSVAARKAEELSEFWALVAELPAGEFEMLIRDLPRKVRAQVERRLAAARTELDKDEVVAEFLLGRVKERLAFHGLYFGAGDGDWSDADDDDHYARHRGAADSTFAEDVDMPEGTRPEDMPRDDPRAGLE